MKGSPLWRAAIRVNMVTVKALVRGLVALAAILSPASYTMASGPIPTELNEDFTHAPSGISVPPMVGAFQRVSVDDLTDEQLNIAIQLREESQDTFVTIYIYRSAVPNLTIWGDFASIAMLNNPSIGPAVEGTLFLGRFTPPNESGSQSALHARALVKGAIANSTGLSVFGHNDWIVKVRATSKSLSEDQVTRKIGAVIASLKMEPSVTQYPEVEFVTPCDKPMKFGKKPKLKAFDVVGQLIVGTTVTGVRIGDEAADSAEVDWCRDPQSTADYGIYRKNNSKSAYFIALSDGGIGAYVSNLRKAGGVGSVNGFLVKTSDGLTEKAWPIFDKKPHPALIRENFGAISPIATQDVRPGVEEGSTINLNMPSE